MIQTKVGIGCEPQVDQMTVVELLDDPDPGIQTKVGIGCEPQVGHGLSDDSSRIVRWSRPRNSDQGG